MSAHVYHQGEILEKPKREKRNEVPPRTKKGCAYAGSSTMYGSETRKVDLDVAKVKDVLCGEMESMRGTRLGRLRSPGRGQLKGRP